MDLQARAATAAPSDWRWIDVKKEDERIPEGYEVVYTAYITLRNGKRLYASAYGRTAWRLVVRKKK
jgi:hypothetical protein